MGKLVFGMMQSLDGYVAGAAGGPQLPPPGDQLHRHFNDYVRESAGIIYGRRMYEGMRYWDDDQPDWGAVERDFVAAFLGALKAKLEVRSMLPDPSWPAVSPHSA
jgi:dihydrofolate reductase